MASGVLKVLLSAIFFCLCKKTFVRLNALIFLGKKSDYANVLNQPFRAFARAV